MSGQSARVILRRPGRLLEADNWIVSETTSPVDYTPIITATTFSQRRLKWSSDATLDSLPRRSH